MSGPEVASVKNTGAAPGCSGAARWRSGRPGPGRPLAAPPGGSQAVRTARGVAIDRRDFGYVGGLHASHGVAERPLTRAARGARHHHLVEREGLDRQADLDLGGLAVGHLDLYGGGTEPDPRRP